MNSVEGKPMGIGKIIFIPIIASLVIGLIVIFCYPLVLAVITFSDPDMCVNEVVKTVSSPDEKYDAIAFLRNCGATTPYTPHVSIVEHGQALPNKKGNIFRGSPGETFVDIYWADNTTLIVQHTISDRGPVQRQKSRMADIEIQYQIVQP